MSQYLSSIISNETEKNAILCIIAAKLRGVHTRYETTILYGTGSNGKTSFQNLVRITYPGVFTFSAEDVDQINMTCDFNLTNVDPFYLLDPTTLSKCLIINFTNVFNNFGYDVTDHVEEFRDLINNLDHNLVLDMCA
jgi:hypothetical protein